MDHRFTAKIKEWLDTPEESRSIEAGATLLLRLNGNRLEYARLTTAMPAVALEHIAYQLQKHYDYRVAGMTHDQVAELAIRADDAVARQLKSGDAPEEETEKGESVRPPRGRRDDHDSLPDEIQACWVENLGLLRRMREVHLRLRSLSLETATCPDSERYPYVKEIVELDKKILANYATYDGYQP